MPLPTPPSRDDPANFSVRADEFLGAMIPFEVEMNNLRDDTVEARAAAQAAAASAVNAPGTNATSTSSLTVGLGSRTLNIQTGKAFAVGQVVQIARTSAPATTWMHGAITAHNAGGGVLTVDVDLAAGSGTFTDWTISVSAPIQRSGVIALDNGSSIADPGGVARSIGYRNLPSRTATTATLALGDVGKLVKASGTVTVPANENAAFGIDDILSIYNSSGSAITISAASGVTLRKAASTLTGNRSLAAYGFATLLKVGADEWLASGAGLT